MKALITTACDLEVGKPYEVLFAKYGVCCCHDNRPAYMRLTVECLQIEKSIHQVVHLVQCQVNQRGGLVVLKDLPILLQLYEMLDYKPSKEIRIEICDLNAFLLVSRQRHIVNAIEHHHWKEFKKKVKLIPVPVTVQLGDYAYSVELIEYIEDIIAHNKTLTPTFERLGMTDQKHELKVIQARRRLKLWTSPLE